MSRRATPRRNRPGAAIASRAGRALAASLALVALIALAVALPGAPARAGELPSSAGVKRISVSGDGALAGGKLGGGMEGFNHVTLLGADGKIERVIVLGARRLPPKPQRKPDLAADGTVTAAAAPAGTGGVDSAFTPEMVQFVALPLAFDPLRGVTDGESKLGRLRPGLQTLEWPIVGARLSSRYGNRVHPILGGVRHHDGIDLAAPAGTPVRAAADGVVAYRGRNGGYGRYIRLDHGFGLQTAYGHLRGYAIGLAAGRRVRQGQVIGYVGSSGLSTGPHLHYEVIRDGRTLNPLDALPPRATQRIVLR